MLKKPSCKHDLYQIVCVNLRAMLKQILAPEPAGRYIGAMTRYRMTIEYDGRAFVGWQRQDNGLGVQQVLEKAVTALSGETQTVYGAGRTDAGVHALGQVAHVDIEREFQPYKVRDALNAHVRPHPVAVLAVEKVSEDFHARFSATGRSYEYRIVNRRAPVAIKRGLAWGVPVQLDSDAMHDAAQALIGNHDFSTFRTTLCQAKSPVKTLDHISVKRHGEDIRVRVSARSFLHNQVRIIVGTLRLVGEGKWTRADVADALAARDRRVGGQTAPPDGLYLTEVRY